MRPPDERLGRRLINGRFEVTEWIGSCEFMGVAVARDHQTGGQVRITTSSDVAPSLDVVRPRLTRDVAGLAPVVFFGPAESDDGWAQGFAMMAESMPVGRPLEVADSAGAELEVARLGARLSGLLRGVHAEGRRSEPSGPRASTSIRAAARASSFAASGYG